MQGTSLLDLVDMLFTRNGIRSLRYDGKMSRDKRERTLREFRSHNGPKVICISIKCGGVGLNLGKPFIEQSDTRAHRLYSQCLRIVSLSEADANIPAKR
jgi:hypothetical protein